MNIGRKNTVSFPQVASRYAEPSAKEIEEKQLHKEMGLSEEEYKEIVHHLGGRCPNWTETGVFSVMWSEHCSYKNSKVLLRQLPTQGKKVIQGPGEGAGVIDIGDNQAVVFKMESHNHPSAVEPFQGAATGVGGILRDIFSMGARPVALLNSLRFGDCEGERSQYLFKEVVRGISHYGNCMGMPTVGGEAFFDPSYEGNPLVNVMCVGLIQHEDIQKGIAEGVGNPVIYIRSSTGRDGIHGATFASEELYASAEAKRPQVQVGDPFMEKLLLEACLEMVNENLLLGIQDMGAAGLTCSSAEMAAKGEVGIELHLDLVPQREQAMSPYEILLSESQERMLLVVEKGMEVKVKEICEKWGLQFAIIGKVTEDATYRIFHKDKQVTDIPVKSLVDAAPVIKKEDAIQEVAYKENPVSFHLSVEEALQKLLNSPNIGSKEWIYRQYDYMVQANTRVTPGSDAAVIFVHGTEKALAMTTDGNSRYVLLDPYLGGTIAVCEAARNIVCSGGKPLGITNCLNFGSPEKPDVYHQLKRVIEGMSHACERLDTPVIGGNVSLYNENEGRSIYPTPIIGMVGLIEEEAWITTQAFKKEKDAIYLLGETFDELGGSELQAIISGKIGGTPPKIDLAAEIKLQRAVLKAIHDGIVQSAHDLSEGGLGIALVESSVGGRLGAFIEVHTELSPLRYLFSESQSRILLSVSPCDEVQFGNLMKAHGVPFSRIGEVQANHVHVKINGDTCLTSELDVLVKTYKEALLCRMSSSSIS
jgi:phosphoribosylformylglycinamidine synthase